MSALNGRSGRILGLASRTRSVAGFGRPSAPHDGQAIALPQVDSAGDGDYVIKTLPFQITGLDLGECAALGNEVNRFGPRQLTIVSKFFD